MRVRDRSTSTLVFLLVTLVVLALTATTPNPAQAVAEPAPAAAADKVEPALLDSFDERRSQGFVIEFEDEADLESAAVITDWTARGRAVADALRRTAERSQAEVVASLEERGLDYQSFWIDNTVHVESGTRSLALDLASTDEVATVREADTVPLEQPRELRSAPMADGVEWGVADIGADRVWDELGVNGDGVVVANIDSGAQYDHPALVGSYRGNNGDGTFDHDYNWWDPSGICTSPADTPCDNIGHGSHTMGTMVGDDGAGQRIGVAPGAQWIAAKGCEYDGCSEAGLTSAAQWILAPTDRTGENPDAARRPHVVNNSWGGPGGDTWYDAFIEAWVASGIFPVFSAGNEGPDCGTAGSPGDSPAAYAVGNYAPNGAIAPTSSRGSEDGATVKPDIAAPGTAVRSSVPGGGYAIYSGTSMAAPHLAGTVALLWSAAPSLVGDIAATRQLLDDTARDTADDQCGGEPDDNPVYGEGRLDAFAVVEAAPRGTTGVLHGTITDAESGQPVPHAHLRLTGASTRAAVSDSDGTYSVTLTPGEYDVEVTRFGYDALHTTAEIRAGDMVAADLQLTPSPPVRLHGTVTDGSGQGWPVYAEVELPGTPLRTFTDPETGRYSLTVPAGSYRVRVTPEYEGYLPRTDELTLDRPTTHDLGLEVDAATCTAPGYARTGGLREDFATDERPVGWTVTDVQGTGQVWEFDDPGERGNRTGGHGDFATVDSDFFGPDGTQDTALVSPAVDLSSADAPVLEFATDFWANWMERAEVDVTVDGGATWSNVWRVFDDVRGPEVVRVAVPKAANQDEVQIRFHYLRGSHDFWWQVDDVFLGEPACEPARGGLLVGQTRSSTTRKPLDGVDVVADAGFATTTSVPTPGDDRVADGFYRLFVPGSGRELVVASAEDHPDARAQVRITPGEVVPLDLALASGRLEPLPHTVVVELDRNRTATRRVTLANTGDAPARFEVEEVPGRPEPVGSTPGDDLAGAPMRHVAADITPLPDAGGTGGTIPTAEPAAPWGELAPYPVPVKDTAAATLDGTLYTFGGSGAEQVPLADSFRYDETAERWEPIADLPDPRQKASGAFIDGRFVVTGGWGADLQPLATTSIYDPETDTWSEGEPNPQPWAASGTAVLNGELYVVGGCLSDDCGRTDVLRYDPDEDSWTRLADYPQNTAWSSCGGISGKVYCAGGIGPEADQFSTYAYDPARDRWTQVADMPLDMWASAYSVADGQLLVAGGAAERSSVLTNEAFAYDPMDDQWSPLPRTGYAFYRSSGACGFTKIGGADDWHPGVPVVERLPGRTDCDAAEDLPWLRTNVRAGQVAGDRTRQLVVTLDARRVPRPGVYDAYLRFRDDTPYPTKPVRVRLVVRR